jgi:hypothetical protein
MYLELPMPYFVDGGGINLISINYLLEVFLFNKALDKNSKNFIIKMTYYYKNLNYMGK